MKRLLYIFTAFCLLVTVFAPSASVLASASPSYTLEGKTVSPGETFTIDIGIKDNPGIISLRLSVTYTEELELLSVANKNLLNGWTAPSATVSSPYTLRWADSLATENNTANGNIVTLTFKAKDTAAALSPDILISHIEARNASGEKVTFAGMTATVNIVPPPAVVTSIAVKTMPTKTSYFVGDTLDTTGLSLTATYNNGTTQTVSSGFTCTPTTLGTAGTQTITVTYNGKTTTFNVTVTAVTLTGVSVKTAPTKTSYYVGDTLNTTGLTLTATYNNGTTQTISSGFTCTPTTLNAVGTQAITVTYSGKTTMFDVTVAEIVLSGITVKTNPTKTSYYVGDTLDTTGLSLTATYNNGKTETVTNGFTCTPTTLNAVGTQAVTVTYNGKTTMFDVTVAEQPEYELDLVFDSELEIDNDLGALTGVGAGTTAANVLSQFSSGDIGIYKDGEPLGENDLVGTGCEVRLMDGDDVLDSLTVVVKGDLDGDGKVNVPDARKALRAAVKLDTISDFQSLAADVDGSGKVEVPDARLILRVAVGLQGF